MFGQKGHHNQDACEETAELGCGSFARFCGLLARDGMASDPRSCTRSNHSNGAIQLAFSTTAYRFSRAAQIPRTAIEAITNPPAVVGCHREQQTRLGDSQAHGRTVPLANISDRIFITCSV